MNVEQEIILTAFALGELEAEELKSAEALLSASAEARSYVAELQDLSQTLVEELRIESSPGLDEARRAVVQEAASGASVGASTRIFADLRPWAAAAAIVLALVGAFSFEGPQKKSIPVVSEQARVEDVADSGQAIPSSKVVDSLEVLEDKRSDMVPLGEPVDSQAQKKAKKGKKTLENLTGSISLRLRVDEVITAILPEANEKSLVAPVVGGGQLQEQTGGKTIQPTGRRNSPTAGFAPSGGSTPGPAGAGGTSGVSPAAGIVSGSSRSSVAGKPRRAAGDLAEASKVDANRVSIDWHKSTKPKDQYGGRVRRSKKEVLLGKPEKLKNLIEASPSYPVDERRARRLRDEVRRRPGESYAAVQENQFKMVTTEPLSTIGLDVDSASYANVRRFLNANRWPDHDAVRVDEMVNYFNYADVAPQGEEVIALSSEVAACPWNLEHRLLRVAFKAKEIKKGARGPSNLVFLVDVSGSMKDQNKLPLLKQGLMQLAKQLGEDDRVAIVTYAGNAALVLPSTRGHDRTVILDSLARLRAGGSTNGASGIQMAYDVATQNIDKEGTNRVILCTDGDFNVGISDTNALVRLIKEKAASGVFLSVLGFGRGNIKDDKMQALANKGNGHYAYIDGVREARKVLVEELEGTLVTVAKDAKMQVEFNPAEVSAYRLLGYQARIMGAQDFNDDKKDGGEIGAGHSVVALYELIPSSMKDGRAKMDSLKYQEKTVAPTVSKGKPGELATVKMRYKLPDQQVSKLRMIEVLDSGKHYSSASTDFQLSSAVALFGMILSHSSFTETASLDTAFELALGGLGTDGDPRGLRKELCGLIQKAKALKP